MDNYRSSGVHYQNQGTNTNANGGKNRNRKKKNKQNQNQNQNMPLSPSKNMINHYSEYGGSMSLDHQSFGRPYNKFANNQNYNYNNQNNRPKYNNNNNNNNNSNNGKFNKRRNGSQSNYYNSSGTYENDRLNKSLTPNSSFGENSKIQTSISLDNFDLVSSLNAKRSPTSSYPLMSSNVIISQKPTSPFKNSSYHQHQQTIVEQVNLEEMSETTTSLSIHDMETKSNDVLSSITSTESLNTSGDFMVDHHTPMSNYSTPMNHSDSSKVFDPDMSPRKDREHEESLNQNDKTPVKYEESEHTVKQSEAKSGDSSAISSSSSPDSKNSDQNLVTASEGESSFVNENLATNHHEHNLAKELEKIAANFELDVHQSQETESNKSVNGSANSSETGSFTTTSNERQDELGDSHNYPEYVTESNIMENLVIQEVKLEQSLEQGKKNDTVIECKKIESKTENLEENTLDAGIDVSLDEKKEQTVVEIDEVVLDQKDQMVEEKITTKDLDDEIQEETAVENSEIVLEKDKVVVDERVIVEELNNDVVADSRKVFDEEKLNDLSKENREVMGEQLDVDGQRVKDLEARTNEILISNAYEINIRPHVEEIKLTDGDYEAKQESDLNIAPIETGNREQTCEQDHQEFEILEQANESIVSESNDRSNNTSIAQKEPAVDCFSCTIV